MSETDPRGSVVNPDRDVADHMRGKERVILKHQQLEGCARLCCRRSITKASNKWLNDELEDHSCLLYFKGRRIEFVQLTRGMGQEVCSCSRRGGKGTRNRINRAGS